MKAATLEDAKRGVVDINARRSARWAAGYLQHAVGPMPPNSHPSDTPPPCSLKKAPIAQCQVQMMNNLQRLAWRGSMGGERDLKHSVASSTNDVIPLSVPTCLAQPGAMLVPQGSARRHLICPLQHPTGGATSDCHSTALASRVQFSPF